MCFPKFQSIMCRFPKITILCLQEHPRYNWEIMQFLSNQMERMASFRDNPPRRPDAVLVADWQDTLRVLDHLLKKGKYLHHQHCKAFHLPTFYSVDIAQEIVQSICKAGAKLINPFCSQEDGMVEVAISSEMTTDDRKDLNAKLDFVLNGKSFEFDEIFKPEWEQAKKDHLQRMEGLQIIPENGTLKTTGTSRAVWFGHEVTYKQRDGLQNLESLAEFLSDVEIMGSLHSPHITRFWGATMSGMLILEESDGQLKDWYRGKTLGEKLAALKEAATGLAFVHDRGVIHRDITSSNFLVFADYPIVRISGFGSARKLEDIRTGTVRAAGTPLYQAPEVCNGGAHSLQSDVFSFGVVMFEVIAGNEPYLLLKNEDEIADAKKGGKYPCPLPNGVPDDLKTLMQECCQCDPSQRKMMSEVKQRLESLTLHFPA